MEEKNNLYVSSDGTMVGNYRDIEGIEDGDEVLLSYVAEYPNVYNEDNHIITVNCKLVLGDLLCAASENTDGVFRRGQKNIMESTDVEGRVVSLCIRRLINLGFIEILEMGSVDTHMTTKYKINYDALENYTMRSGRKPKKKK